MVGLKEFWVGEHIHISEGGIPHYTGTEAPVLRAIRPHPVYSSGGASVMHPSE